MKAKKILGIFYVLILLSNIGFGNILYAKEPDPSEKEMCVTQNDLKTNVQAQQKVKNDDEGKKVVQEALNAYNETLKAVDFLDHGQKDKALDALAQAVGKLDILVASFPQIAYLPINSEVKTLNLAANLDSIKQQRDQVESLVKNGYLQQARRILDYFASEIRITSVNLPMATYPAAIKAAAKLIEENKLKEAKDSLAATLSTVVISENSIPIPVINSQFLIKQASQITAATTPDKLSKDKKTQALDLLSRANHEFEIAEELGYGKRDGEFAQLNKDINEIEGKVTNNEESLSFFDKLKVRLENFKNRISI